jgi:outer membrane receptor protein involved in Fe transport
LTNKFKYLMACSAAFVIAPFTMAAAAQPHTINIPSEEASKSIPEFAQQVGVQVIAPVSQLHGVKTQAVHGNMDVPAALSQLLNGTGLEVAINNSDTITLRRTNAAAPAEGGSAAAPENVEQVVVSGSRLQSAGFDLPTPTTVVDASFINNSGQTNVVDTLAQLPALSGTQTLAIMGGGTGINGKGVSALNLRGLGLNRVLVTIDSQRIVNADQVGFTDVSSFPQLLLKRVDIVTGGASAAYGSDAISGIVNFVTDKKFEGIKGDASSGISTYGDNQQAQLRLAAGTSFLGGRGHIEGAVEYTYNQGVPDGPAGNNVGANGRNWFVGQGNLSYNAPTATTPTNTPAGMPQINFRTNTQTTLFSTYGLITGGPAALVGNAFGASGVLSPYNYGVGVTGVTPARTTASIAANCLGSLCVGGDNTANFADQVNVTSSMTRGDVYSRLSYDIGQESEIYATALVSHVRTGSGVAGAQRQTGLSIACGNAAGGPNAFLSASINAACVAANQTSFTFGVSTANFTPNATVKTNRETRRFVVGSDGKFDIFGQDWNYDVYYEHGETDSSIRDYLLNVPHFNAALDAVAGPGGTIVCRSVAAQASGCVPINLFGNNQQSLSALNYINSPQGEFMVNHLMQDVASVTVNGEPFSLWAGPVALATGVEYRQEKYLTYGDPWGSGFAQNPATALYPNDGVVPVTGGAWFVGNFHNGAGNYHVSEGFVELGIPLLNSNDWGKIDANLAGRATGYSTSGYVNTWKVGATWQTPVDGLKFRALQSRDIRAPNLNELYAPQTQAPINGTNPQTGVAFAVRPITNTIGNPALKPEKSQTTEVGVVFQPSWFPGFSSSLDYYRVAIKGQIGTLTGQNELDTCFASNGKSVVCSALIAADGTTGSYSPTFITLQSFNLASTVTDGFDMEASYQFDLSQWDVGGNFSLRALVNHTSKFISDSGIAGVPVAETAGVNVAPSTATPFGNVPLWRTYTTEEWSNDKLSLNLTERWFSDGVFNKSYITCAPGTCPVTTVANPTTNFNHMIGAFYLDAGASYNVADKVQVWGKVDNLVNIAPAVQNTGFYNGTLYDGVGRMFRIGVRFSN